MTDDSLTSACKVERKRHRQVLPSENENLSVNEKFGKFASCAREHGKQYFGYNNNFQTAHKEWFTSELKEIVDQKAKAYVDWQLHQTTGHENKYRKVSQNSEK